MQTKIGIIGIGAIGSVISKVLSKNYQNDLTYYSRSAKTSIQIEYNSIRASFPIYSQTHNSTHQKPDWLIICLKAYHFANAGYLFESLIDPETKVAIIRNGINLKADLEPFANRDYILPCMIDCSVQPQEDGYYLQLNHPVITTPKSTLASEFSDLFFPEEINVHQVDDFKTANWKKLIESASIGGLQCLTNQTCQIFQDEKILGLYKKLIKEGVQVARCDGAKITSAYEEDLLKKIKQYPNNKGSSMLTDMKLGNQIELEAKNGAISNMGKYYNIETPLNDLLCALINRINRVNNYY